MHRKLDEIRPSPENDKLYRPVDASDPEIIALADSIREIGVREPIVVTLDGWILSGHRRYAAARLAGLDEAPCRIEPIRRDDDIDEFVRLLREYNRQREKSSDEKLREELVTLDPHEAYQSLIEHRREQSRVDMPALQIVGHKTRKRITAAKQPMLDAIQRVLTERRDFWPLSDRQIHYALLNDPPLIHAAKTGSRYRNDNPSYNALTELLTRARLAGKISMDCIADETRGVTTWSVHRDVRGFIRDELDGCLKGYWRDLMQSQPNHVEILAEKNTLIGIIRPVAERFCIPVTSGRGFASLPPRADMVGRYRASGKEKLIVLIVSDHDPDGETIAHSFARSLRDDFGVGKVHAIKVALTAEQVERYALPPALKAKEGSATYKAFVEKYGEHVYEVEALPPETLQAELTAAIDSVIDIAAFNGEMDRERADASYLEGRRRTVKSVLQGLIDAA